MRETVSLGQAYALMLALQAVALWAVVHGRSSTAGVAVGAAVAAKLAAVPVLLLLAVRGSFRSVVVALGTVVILAGLTVGFAGLDGWSRFIGVLGDDVFRPPPSVAVTAFQSTTGLFMHLFAPDPQWNPGAVATLPALATAVALVATGVVLGLTLWLGRDGRADVAVAAAITAGVLVVNLTQEHHLTMLLVPAVVSLARWLETSERRVLDIAWLALAFFSARGAAPIQGPDTRGWVDRPVCLSAALRCVAALGMADPRPLARSTRPRGRRRSLAGTHIARGSRRPLGWRCTRTQRGIHGPAIHRPADQPARRPGNALGSARRPRGGSARHRWRRHRRARPHHPDDGR